MIRVVLADDNPLMLMGLRSLLDTSDEVEVIGEAADGIEAVELVERLNPDVVLLDVQMPRMDGLAAASRIVGRAKILMLTSSEDPDVIQTALATGATGYLVHGAHTADGIVAAVVSAARGHMVLASAAAEAAASAFAGAASWRGGGRERTPGVQGFGLTTREAEIMTFVAEGLTNREIASTCFLAEKTVKNHINRILAKLGVRTRAEAVSRWLRATGAGGDALR